MAKKKKTSVAQPAWVKYSWWIVPLLAIAIYLPSLTSGFTLDDVPIIEENVNMTSLDKIPVIWTSHYWSGKLDATDTGLYRPLTLTTYNLQYVLEGKEPGPFHALNILLHALVCFVLMKFIALVFKDPMLMVLSGVLFALHPLHTEAVCGIVGRAELLAGLFILTAGISYHHWRKTGGWIWMMWLLMSTFLAIASKEHGFMLPAILVLQELYYYFTWKNYSWSERSKWIGLSGVSLVAVVMFLYRSAVTGPPVPHELWDGVSAGNRVATAIRISAEYIGMHFFPWTLSADYWIGEAPIADWGNWKALVALLMVSAIAFMGLAWRKKYPVIAWGISFFFLTLLPVSNILFAAGFIKAERILYIPSMGLIVSMSAVLVFLAQNSKLKWLGYGLAGVLTVFFAGRTWIRNYDWKDNYALAAATLKTAPDSPRMNNMMGLEMRAQHREAETLQYLEKAVQLNPKHVPALVNLGTEYRNVNRLPEAAAILEQALALDPNTLATYVNLMSVYRSMDNFDKNVEVAEKAMAKFPTSAPVLWNAANAYQLKGDMAKANDLREKAQLLDPGIGGGK
jgi:protein O-mannosyl-transferase